MYKYIGRIVEIIYVDRQNRITQRTVSIHQVTGQTVRVFDVEKRALRSLRLENILAVQPVSLRVG